MSFDVFQIPKSLLEKVQAILDEGKEENPERSPLQETSAPGQEHWIKSNKARFEKEYGTEKGKQVLYAKAWKMHKEETETEETEPDKKQIAVAPRHSKDGSKVLLEKGKKKDKEELEEKEKIIFNPEVHPDRITEPDKVQKTT